MSARERGAARRYAQALFDLALKHGQAEDVRGELRAAAATIERHAELRSLLLNPALSSPRKKGIVAALWAADAGPKQLVGRLLGLLAERHRVALLPDIEQLYGELWNAHRQVLSAELVSATGLDAAQLEGLRDAVRRRTGRDVEFQTRVDARLLGGVRLTLEGRVYDGSVRGRLAALRAHLGAGGRMA